MEAFESSQAKDWIRRKVDLPVIRRLSALVRGLDEPFGYVGTPGPRLLDIVEWRSSLDFVMAAEYDPPRLRDLVFNARRLFPDGFVQATSLPIEQLLSRAGDEWFVIFDDFSQWPALVNYDVYANPVLPHWEAFRPDDGFWKGMKVFLHEVGDTFPNVLVLVTTNLRGKSREYDIALRAIFAQIRDYGVEIGPGVERAFLGGSMSKKCQVCVPYWLSRFAATHQNFSVEVVESLDYCGTESVRMMHMILLLRPGETTAAAKETPLLKFVNFPHCSLVQATTGEFSMQSTGFPTVGAMAAKAPSETSPA